MRDVTIQRGACDVFVEGIAKPCPTCLTLVREGEFHRCKLAEPPTRRQATRQQPHKGAK